MRTINDKYKYLYVVLGTDKKPHPLWHSGQKLILRIQPDTNVAAFPFAASPQEYRLASDLEVAIYSFPHNK